MKELIVIPVPRRIHARQAMCGCDRKALGPSVQTVTDHAKNRRPDAVKDPRTKTSNTPGSRPG